MVRRSLDFTVRQAVAADIPLIAHHRAAMFRDMGTLASDQEEVLRAATTSYLRDALETGEYLGWMAEATETSSVIGGAGAQIRSIIPRLRPGSEEIEFGPEALVVNVYVEPPWRRRGVADAVMRAVLDGLAGRGIRRIVLHASDDGRRLYERLGFVATNEMRLGRG